MVLLANNMLQSQPNNSIFNNTVYITSAIAIIIAMTLLYPGLAQNLLSATGFMPHGHCYLWKPELVWLHVSTDLLIGSCYVAISTTLAYLVYRTRREIPFHWMFLVFGAFIVACGATHFMEVLTLWHPVYWLAGDVKLVTALASVAAALTLPPLVPKVEGLLATLKLAEERRQQLEAARQNSEAQTWLKTNVAELSRLLQGQRNLETAAQLILSRVASLIGAQQGGLYWRETQNDLPELRWIGGYAYQKSEKLRSRIAFGEGLIGQCALDNRIIHLDNLPSDYIRINSSLGETAPRHLIVLPILFESEVVAVMEFASLEAFAEPSLTLLQEICDTLGVILTTIAATAQTTELLNHSQALTEELRLQQRELQETNQRLEEQAEELQVSAAQLRDQQEELQQSNEQLQQLNAELEEKAYLLEARNREVEQKNRDIEQARQVLEQQASELALSSRYKSEFLANMSHELRTPLNSLLILARLLSENREGNLTERQQEYSSTIYASGKDLLSLIDDILDLAKIESRTLSLHPEPFLLKDLQGFLAKTFRQVAQDKGLDFRIELDQNLPKVIITDAKRLQQILKNLLANAFKFTERGSVALSITQVQDEIAFSVRDTGIGIPAEKLQLIFEAFQQGDGTTSRKYGGTGLGLSISRELAQLLGGRIEVESQERQGSRFTVYLPPQQSENGIPPSDNRNGAPVKVGSGSLSQTLPTEDSIQKNNHSNGNSALVKTVAGTVSQMLPIQQVEATKSTAALSEPAPASSLSHQSDPILQGKNILIVDDDVRNIYALASLLEEHDARVRYAENGRAGLEILQTCPDINIVLMDIMMPEMDGYEAMQQIRQQEAFRSLPIIALTAKAMRGDREKCLEAGASDYISKPVQPEQLLSLLRVWLYQ